MRSINENSISDIGAKALASSLKDCRDLTSVRYCPVAYRARTVAVSLVTKVSNQSCCSCIGIWMTPWRPRSLHENKIGDEGARALAAGLKNCSSLQSIVYVSVRVIARRWTGKDSSITIATFCANRSCYLCSLWRNRIGAEGARALAAGLVNWAVLETF